MFYRFSPPEQLHSDQGRQFESELMGEVCKLLQIKKSRTTPYHPQGDGLVERFNRTLLNMLATTTADSDLNWEQNVRAVCMAYNTSVQPTTGFTPYYLMFGRQARVPVDLMFGTTPVTKTALRTYAEALKQNLDTAYEQVRAKMGTQLLRQKTLYDKNIHGDPYKEGDLVWLHSTVVPRGYSRKLHHPWSGPFKVIKKLSDGVYRIRHTKGRHKRIVVHFDRLKPCSLTPSQGDAVDATTTRKSPPQSSIDNQAHEFGRTLQLIDSDHTSVHNEENTRDNTSRYPRRDRHPPARYGSPISH